MENKNLVTGDMLVGQIVNEHPEAVDTLMEIGMHCLGCPSSQMESLADAAYVHGHLDPQMVVDTVNKKIGGAA